MTVKARWKPEEVTKIITLHKRQLRPHEIHTHLPTRTTKAIKYKLLRLGYKTHRTNGWKQNEIDYATYFRKQGKTYAEIGELLNRTPQAVKKKLQRIQKPAQPKPRTIKEKKPAPPQHQPHRDLTLHFNLHDYFEQAPLPFCQKYGITESEYNTLTHRVNNGEWSLL